MYGTLIYLYYNVACAGEAIDSVITASVLCCITVLYLVLFHPLIFMMCWCYWETIFTPVATTPKQVRERQLLQLSDRTQLKIILTEV